MFEGTNLEFISPIIDYDMLLLCSTATNLARKYFVKLHYICMNIGPLDRFHGSRRTSHA